MRDPMASDKALQDADKEFHIVRSESLVTPSERKLCMYFKCTKFSSECYWTGNSSEDFLNHLIIKHPNEQLCCIYCNNPHEEAKKTFPANKDLVDHIIYTHPFRIFQCSQCLYRGASITQIKKHLRLNHGVQSEKLERKRIFVCRQIVYGPRPHSDRRPLPGGLPSISSAHHQVQKAASPSTDSLPVSQTPPALLPENREKLKTVENNLVVKNEADLEMHQKIVTELQSEFTEEESAETKLNCESGTFKIPVVNARKENLVEPIKPVVKPSPKAEKKPKMPPKSALAARDEKEREIESRNPEADGVVVSKRKRVNAKVDHQSIVLNPLGPKPLVSGGMFKCILCEPPTEIKECKIEWHCRSLHGSEFSTKCRRCNFVGSKQDIYAHYAEKHGGGDTIKMVNFIVPAHTSDISLASTSSEDPKQPQVNNKLFQERARQFVAKKGNVAKKSVGNHLSQAIKGSIYMGPKSWAAKSKARGATTTITAVASGLAPVAEPVSPTSPSPLSSTASFKTASEDSKLPEMHPGMRAADASQKNKKHKLKTLVKLKDSSARGDIHYFCLFCSEHTTDGSAAIKHMQQHLGFGYSCNFCGMKDTNLQQLKHHYHTKHRGKTFTYKEDATDRRNIVNWIVDFLNEQFADAFLEASTTERELDIPYVECSLCIKAAKRQGRRAKKFTSFQKFTEHFRRHTRWERVDCVVCAATVNRTERSKHLQKHHPDERSNEANLFLFRSDQTVSAFLEGQLTAAEGQFWDKVKAAHGCVKEVNVKLINMDHAEIRRIQAEYGGHKEVELVDLDDDDLDDEQKAMRILSQGSRDFETREGVEREVNNQPEASLAQENGETVRKVCASNDASITNEAHETAVSGETRMTTPSIDQDGEISLVEEVIVDVSTEMLGNSTIPEVDDTIAADDVRKAFTKTLTDELKFGCGHCCTPDARFSNRKLWREHHVSQHSGLPKFLISRPNTERNRNPSATHQSAYVH